MTRLPDRQSPCRIDQGKGRRRHPCSRSHAELVEDFRREQHQQELRAEAATNGYATELAAYFGEDGAGDAVERRLTFRDWLSAHSERAHAEESAA